MDAFLNRRRFLRHSAAFGGSIFVFSIALDRSTNATPVRIEPPAVDEVTVREITDGSHDIFMHGEKRPGLIVTRTGTPEAAQGKTLESEWGLALHIEPRKGQETRRYLLDFGFTPGVYTDNLEILKIDVAQVDPLIISPGHYDHIGGLMGIPGDSARLGCAEICACTSPGKTVSAIAISATWMAALPKSAPRWIDVGCEP